MGFGAEKVAYLNPSTYHRPNSDEVWPGRRNEPIGVYAQSSGQSRPLAAFDFTPEPSVQEVEVLLSPNEVIQTDPMRLFRTRVNGSEEAYVNPLAQPDGMPGVAFQWLEVEGPLADQNAARRLPPDVRRPADAPPRKRRNGRRDAPDPRSAAVHPAKEAEAAAASAHERRMSPSKWSSEHPREDAERLIRAFLARAYRRPVEEAHVKRFLELFNQQFELGHGFTKSLLSAYTAVLCSPGFVFVEEAPGRLDDYALATRLALFLWNSPPDDELRALAAQGRLSRPEVLRAQTERLLNDPKVAPLRRRVHRLLARPAQDRRHLALHHPLQRLRTRRPAQARRGRRDAALRPGTAQPQPAGAQHRRFRLHLPQRAAGQTLRHRRRQRGRDAQGRAAERLRPRRNHDAGQRPQGDRQRHHDVAGAPRRLDHGAHPGLPHRPARGRARFEPDIRGAVTIRQQLDRHRADPTCASCHRKIDPPGFALESFDVMGGWRDRYRAVAEDAKPEPGIGLSGQPFAFHYGLPVDSAGALTDGRAFKDIREFKRLLLDHEEQTVARNLVSQLATYATGAPIGFSDRKQVEEVLDKTRGSGYGVRDIVHGIVQSDLFRNK